MGGLSIWHWVIVFLFLFFGFGLPAIAVRNERSNIRLRRSGFVWWVAIPMAIAFTMELAGAALGLVDFIVVGIISVLACAYEYFFFQRVVRRARDAGLGKAIAYWSIVPIVNIGTTLFLLFKPSAELPEAGTTRS